MKRFLRGCLPLFLALAATGGLAAEDPSIASLQEEVRLLRARLDVLERRVAEASTNPPPVASVAAARPLPNDAASASVAPSATLEQLTALNARLDEVEEAQKKTLPSEFNPAIGLVGETLFSYRSQPSDKTGNDRPGGFDVFQRSVELNASASVDPFTKAWVVANASADAATGESTLGIEEAAVQTTGLSDNLTLTAGRFFGEFGRLSDIHDHELPFVNRPLVLDRYIGGESQSDGLQANWLVPIEHYLSVTWGIGDHFGGDAPNPDNPGHYRAFTGLNTWGRISTYTDLTPDWQFEYGLSGLLCPHEQDRGGVLTQPNGLGLVPLDMVEKGRRLVGLDFKFSYVPLQDNQFRSFTWGTEILHSDNNYLFDPDGSLNPANPSPGLSGDEYRRGVSSDGLYSYLCYKWSREWSGGVLYDWLQNPENNADRTRAYSAFVTWALSHWNQLRLEYTHTEHEPLSGLKNDNAIYLQWCWIIGSHSHGWQQR